MCHQYCKNNLLCLVFNFPLCAVFTLFTRQQTLSCKATVITFLPNEHCNEHLCSYTVPSWAYMFIYCQKYIV